MFSWKRMEAQKTQFCKLKSSQDSCQTFPQFSDIGQIRLRTQTVQIQLGTRFLFGDGKTDKAGAMYRLGAHPNGTKKQTTMYLQIQS